MGTRDKFCPCCMIVHERSAVRGQTFDMSRRITEHQVNVLHVSTIFFIWKIPLLFIKLLDCLQWLERNKLPEYPFIKLAYLITLGKNVYIKPKKWIIEIFKNYSEIGHKSKTWKTFKLYANLKARKLQRAKGFHQT